MNETHDMQLTRKVGSMLELINAIADHTEQYFGLMPYDVNSGHVGQADHALQHLQAIAHDLFGKDWAEYVKEFNK